MDFLKKLFSSNPHKYKHTKGNNTDIEPSDMPIDELFVSNFIKNGGKFFYPDDMEDFKNKLKELMTFLQIDTYNTLERSYYHFFKKLKVPVSFGLENSEVLLSGCENLIASEGAIMTTASHTSTYRNSELPQTRVIIALSNQIVADKEAALSLINKKYEKPPGNIQTMSVFSKPNETLSSPYWYDTYLFLIEN